MPIHQTYKTIVEVRVRVEGGGGDHIVSYQVVGLGKGDSVNGVQAAISAGLNKAMDSHFAMAKAVQKEEDRRLK